MSLLVDAAGDLVVLPRDAVELVERRRPVQGRLVLVVDALGHVLEPGQDEALLRRGAVDPAPHEALRELRGFVRDHPHPRWRFRVPLWILGREVLVHVDPCVAVAVPYYRIKAPVSAHTPQFPQRHNPMRLSRMSHIRFVNPTTAILSCRTLSRLRYPGCESPYL
jgi:hypothetical protein